MGLFDSVRKGDLDCIKTVPADYILNVRDKDGRSVISAAIEGNEFDCCKEILKKCPSLLYFQENHTKDTLLHYAIYSHKYTFVDYFLSVGLDAATYEEGSFMKWINLKNLWGDTALTMAASRQLLHTVKRLIEVDREYKLGLLGIVGSDSMTALQLAVKNQDHEMIKLLTDKGEGDPYSDYIPYSIAMDLFDHVKNGDLDYVKTVRTDVLLKSRDDENRNSALGIATQYDQLGCSKEILKRCPILIYHQNSSNETVLHYSITSSNVNYKLFDFIVGVGLDTATIEGNAEIKAENMQCFKNWINLRNFRGHTALLLAVKNHNLDVVKRLLQVDRQYKLGLSEITGYNKKTPLQLASDNKDQEMIKLLTEGTDLDLEHGANTDGNISLSIATTQDEDALHTRNNINSAGTDPDFEYGNIDLDSLSLLVDLFDRIKSGDLDYIKTVPLDVLENTRDDNLMSALSIATIEDQLDCCREILRRCPLLLYHQNSTRNTVLHHATYYGNGIFRLVNLFVSAGLDAAKNEDDKGMERFKMWIKLQNDDGDTGLTQAAYYRNHDIVKRFVELDQQYKLGLSQIAGYKKKTAMEWALEYQDIEMIKLLIDLHNGATEGTDPDFEYGANTDGNMSVSITTTQAEEALHTGNNNDSAGKDAMDRMDDFYVGEFDKNSSTDSTTRILYNLANEKPRSYSHAQLIKFTKEFSDPVGSGGFGVVYKGEFPNGVPIAVKVLNNSMSELMKKQFEAEVSTMGRTYHRNLIKLYGHCYEVDKKALIYEYMEEGDLDVILKKKYLDMKKLYTIATEIARGISYLHEHCNPPIVHHDLKPANVLLDSKFSPRVIDFGLATFNLEKSKVTHSRRGGSRGYIAPEITLPGVGRISSKCDVYSFGMMLFDILKSQINYEDQRWLPGQVWEKFKENKLDNFLKEHGIKEADEANGKTLSMVALSCSEHYPQKRPSMSSVVKMFEGDMTPCPSADPFPYYMTLQATATA